MKYNPREMIVLRIVRRAQDREFVLRLIILLLVFSLVPLAEIFLFIYLGNLLGVFPVLAAAALTGIAGVLLSLRGARRVIASVRGKIRRGERPEGELVDLAGMAAGSLLLLTPGFITDLAGFLLMVPKVRRLMGKALTRIGGRRMREMTDYLLSSPGGLPTA